MSINVHLIRDTWDDSFELLKFILTIVILMSDTCVLDRVTHVSLNSFK